MTLHDKRCGGDPPRGGRLEAAPDPPIVSAGGSASGISAGDSIAANALANFGAAAAPTAQQLSTLPLPCSIVPL